MSPHPVDGVVQLEKDVCRGVTNIPCLTPRGGAGKKRRFSAPLLLKNEPRIPQARDLRLGPPGVLPPPERVAKVCSHGELFVGIDVETNQRVSGHTKGWRVGQFGFQTKASDDILQQLRIVEIGWAVGDMESNSAVVKSYLIRPDGFSISDEATNIHNISHAAAAADGIPLQRTLGEMLTDVLSCCRRGGRLCSHHLHFDASIIMAEMARSGFDDMCEQWATVARMGVCTMDPDIAHWVRTMMGTTDIPYFIPMRLTDMVLALLPGAKDLLAKHHRANTDALMHMMLCCELARRARSTSAPPG